MRDTHLDVSGIGKMERGEIGRESRPSTCGPWNEDMIYKNKECGEGRGWWGEGRPRDMDILYLLSRSPISNAVNVVGAKPPFGQAYETQKQEKRRAIGCQGRS